MQQTRWKALAATVIGVACASACLVVDPLEAQRSASAGAGGAGGAGGSAGSGGSAGGALGACQRNSECSALAADEPYRCRPSDHTCVPLRTPECPVVLVPERAGEPAYLDDNALYLGAYAPINPATPTESVTAWNYQLALDEVSGALNGGGLPKEQLTEQGSTQTIRQPVVMVLCNNDLGVTQNDPEHLDRTLEHLVNQVQVPGILAPLLPDDLLAAVDYAVAKNVFLVSPVGATSPILNAQDEGLVWHMLGKPSDVSPTYVALLSALENYIRAEGAGRDRTGDYKVLTVRSKNAFDLDLDNATSGQLKFNGRDAASNLQSGHLQSYVLDPQQDLNQTAAAIIDAKPDIIVSYTGSQFSGQVLRLVESQWDTRVRPRPFYLLSPLDVTNMGPVLEVLDGLRAGRIDETPYTRFVGVGVAPAPDRTLYDAYFTRLLNAHSSASGDFENFYDAAYFLLYSLYAANASGTVAQVTGKHLAFAMERLVVGSFPLNVGPEDVASVFATLKVPENTIKLNGTLGPPDFDPVSGVRRDVGDVYCIDSELKYQPHALAYDPNTKSLVDKTGACAQF